MPQRAQIPFEGVLNCWNDEHDLPDLLLFIGRSAKTGILQFSNPESDKTLHFKNGKIVFAESSSQDDDLGQFLLRTGKISLMDYARVAKKIRPGKRFGKILVEEKILASQELVPAVVGQVRGILLGLFRRTETWYSFKEMDLPPTQSVTLDLPVARIVLEGVRYVESWRRISKGVGNLDSVYRRSDSKAVEWSRMKLDARVRELLDMMEQPMSLEDICTRATLPDFEACRYLWAFRSLEWIENANANVDVTEQAAAKSATPAAPMALPPEAVVTKIAITPPPASVPVEADGSLPERLVETQMSLKREAEAAVRATEAAKIEIEQDSPAPPPANELVQTQLANEPGPSTPQPEQTRLVVEPPPAPPQLNQTQLAVEPPPAPAQLNQTQLVVEPPPAPPQLNQTQLAVEPPAPPRPDLSKLVVKPPPAAPQLVQTQLAVKPPASAPLDQTQLVVEPPAPPRPDQTQLVVEPPASTPPANQTQLIVESPAPPPSTGELMETILEGGALAPVLPQASDDEDDTQFFQMPSSPASSAPTGPPSGFEALATDPVPTEAPMPAEVVTNPSVRAPIVELGETSEPLSGIEAAPLEAGFMESFAAEPPLETAKVPKAPHLNELELELDPEGIEKALGDD